MLLAIGLLKKQNKTKQKQKQKEKKSKLHEVWAIPIPTCISTTKDVICCSNGYIYHFLDYIKLLLFFNVIYHV